MKNSPDTDDDSNTLTQEEFMKLNERPSMEQLTKAYLTPTPMSENQKDLLGKVHRQQLPDVDKQLIKLGVQDEHGRLTEDGRQTVMEILYAQPETKELVASFLEPLWKKGKKGQPADENKQADENEQ